MKRNIVCLSTLFSLLLIFNSFAADAQTAVINWTGRGWYTPTGENSPSFADDNYYVGDARGDGCGLCTEDSRNFFVFDLSSITRPIGSATLVLTMPGEVIEGFPTVDAGYLSNDPSEKYELHDVTTSVVNLLDGTGGVAAHRDLGDGVEYGSRTMTEADNGADVEIALNSSAIAAMNLSHGLFGIGGSITTLDDLPNNEGVFAWSTGVADISQLRLTLVPEPTSAALFALPAVIFGLQRSRIRSV